MTEDEAEWARFERALDRFRFMGAEAAQEAFLSALEPDSTDEALFAAAFNVLIGFIDDLDQALAAEDIQPNGELGQRIKKAAQGAFGTRLFGLLRARTPGGVA